MFFGHSPFLIGGDMDYRRMFPALLTNHDPYNNTVIRAEEKRFFPGLEKSSPPSHYTRRRTSRGLTAAARRAGHQETKSDKPETPAAIKPISRQAILTGILSR